MDCVLENVVNCKFSRVERVAIMAPFEPLSRTAFAQWQQQQQMGELSECSPNAFWPKIIAKYGKPGRGLWKFGKRGNEPRALQQRSTKTLDWSDEGLATAPQIHPKCTPIRPNLLTPALLPPNKCFSAATCIHIHLHAPSVSFLEGKWTMKNERHENQGNGRKPFFGAVEAEVDAGHK